MTSNTVNNEFDSKLVDIVRANPALYVKDVRSSPYNSMKKKIELWNSIAASLDTDTAYCISRWKSLRDRFRRELQKSKQLDWETNAVKGAPWILFDKLNFLQKHIKYHTGKFDKQKITQKNVPTWGGMDAESLIEEGHDDDPLQEAMDEQCNYDRDRGDAVTVAATSTTTSNHTQFIGSLKRIEVLLDGLDDANRIKAEKRIVAYLCKCQLKSLNNEDVDDVAI